MSTELLAAHNVTQGEDKTINRSQIKQKQITTLINCTYKRYYLQSRHSEIRHKWRKHGICQHIKPLVRTIIPQTHSERNKIFILLRSVAAQSIGGKLCRQLTQLSPPWRSEGLKIIVLFGCVQLP